MSKAAQMSWTTAGVAVAVSARTRSNAQLACRLGQLEVVRSKVVAPLRDAMRFIHREEGDAHTAQISQKTFVVEAFGRDVQQLQGAGAQLLADFT